MSFKKPFRSTPVRLGAYQRSKLRGQQLSGAAKTFGIAMIGGIFAGGLMHLSDTGKLTEIPAAALQFAASRGVVRARSPQSGDYWSGCDDARSAGVVPLHAGEPGYRPEMDGDSDGIACEPYRGY